MMSNSWSLHVVSQFVVWYFMRLSDPLRTKSSLGTLSLPQERPNKIASSNPSRGWIALISAEGRRAKLPFHQLQSAAVCRDCAYIHPHGSFTQYLLQGTVGGLAVTAIPVTSQCRAGKCEADGAFETDHLPASILSCDSNTGRERGTAPPRCRWQGERQHRSPAPRLPTVTPAHSLSVSHRPFCYAWKRGSSVK